MEKHLKAIIESKDKTILNLQLQILQLAEANNKIDNCTCEDCECDCKKQEDKVNGK